MKKSIFFLVAVLGIIGTLFFSHDWTNRTDEEMKDYTAAVLEQLFSTEEGNGWKEVLWEEEAFLLNKHFQIKEEENQREVKRLFQEKYGAIEFEILEIIKSKTNVKVKVKANTKSFFAAADAKAKVLRQEIKEKNEKFEYQDLTVEEYQLVWEEGMMEALRESFQAGEYGQPVEMDLHIIKKESGSWEISEEELGLLYRKVFSYPMEE